METDLGLLCLHPINKVVQDQRPSKVWIIVAEIREAYLMKERKIIREKYSQMFKEAGSTNCNQLYSVWIISMVNHN